MSTSSSYPHDYDEFEHPNTGDKVNDVVKGHSNLHKKVNAALTAIQTTLGLDPQGGYTTIAERLANPIFATGVELAGEGNILTGTGFPESVITAPVGTEYIDTAATNGAVKWIKATGVGNTGWKTIYSDTGWRDIAALAENGWTLGIARIRRVNEMVYFYLGMLAGVTGTSNVLITLPSGFRSNWSLDRQWRPTNQVSLQVASSGALSWSTGTGPVIGNEWCEHKWFTSNVWPIVLPGVAA